MSAKPVPRRTSHYDFASPQPITQLAESFNQSGSDYKQLKRTGNIALYEVWRDGNVSWEVIIIRGEKYPVDMAFGIDGWQFLKIADAEACMRNEVYLAETE